MAPSTWAKTIFSPPFSFLSRDKSGTELQGTVGRLNADWLLRNICHSVTTLLNADWLSSRECHVKVEIFQLQRICRATNPGERACLCRAKVWRDKSKIDDVIVCVSGVHQRISLTRNRIGPVLFETTLGHGFRKVRLHLPDPPAPSRRSAQTHKAYAASPNNRLRVDGP